MASQSVDIHQFEKLRPLGVLEQFSSARHHLGFYHNVGISASYTCHSESPMILKDKIFSALSVLIQKHSILSAIPVDEGTSHPYFARLPFISLENAVAFMTRKVPLNENERDVELDEILEKQHNTSFKQGYGSLPFWRVIILLNPTAESEFVACYIFHHALGDGASGIAFHTDFLSALQTSPHNLASSVVIPPNKDLLPTLEAVHPFQIPTTTPHTPANLWSGGKITAPTTSQFRSLAIPASVTQAFLRVCRAHGTTLTSVLPVLIATALINQLPETFKELECTIPVSLRRWLSAPIDENAMGIWIDAFSLYYRRENLEKFSWDAARKSKEGIRQYLSLEGEKINIAKLSQVKDMVEYFSSKVGMERGSSFSVSNLGGMRRGGSEEEEKAWKMGRIVFSRSAFVAGSAFSTGTVTGPDGCLVLGFEWQEGVVDKELVETVIETAKSEMEAIALEQ